MDDKITALAERLDAWCGSGLDSVLSGDRAAQGSALQSGIQIVHELDRLKEQAMSVLAELLERANIPGDKQVASLIQGFEFGAKFANKLYDELMDTDGGNKVVRLMNSIADTLDRVGAGRAALAVLLDHPDAGARASAGAYLINLMPDRVLPILHQVEEQEHANNAHFTAYFARRGWELEGKDAGRKST